MDQTYGGQFVGGVGGALRVQLPVYLDQRHPEYAAALERYQAQHAEDMRRMQDARAKKIAQERRLMLRLAACLQPEECPLLAIDEEMPEIVRRAAQAALNGGEAWPAE